MATNAANLAALLRDAAARWPDRPALAFGKDMVATQAQLAETASRLGAGLAEGLGLATGNRVAIAMTNCPAYLEAMFAIWHAGLVAVPMNAKLHPREFGYILENAGARACFVTADLEAAIIDASADAPGLETIVRDDGRAWADLAAHDPMAMANVAADDLAWLFYTSGTTGRPKGAMLSHRNLRAMNEAYFASVDDIAETDSIVHAAPLSHGSGLYALPHAERGARQVVPASGGFDAAEILELLPHHPGATFFMAPTMLTRFLAAPGLANADLANLKTIVYGGGPMYVEDCLQALDALGPRLVQIYGQGEAPMTITCLSRALHADAAHPRYRDRLASVGLAQHGVEVRVADAEDNDVAPGEIGEVLVRGDVVMKGYWRNPEASAETLRGGWLHTGDMGALDGDGFLTLKDRSKDVIISGGSNIYPREVEEALLTHPGVRECSVIGRPHSDWGEEVVAFVVIRDGASATEAELDAACLANIARFKRPKAYRFIDALPKNNYGKVLKTALREML